MGQSVKGNHTTMSSTIVLREYIQGTAHTVDHLSYHIRINARKCSMCGTKNINNLQGIFCYMIIQLNKSTNTI